MDFDPLLYHSGEALIIVKIHPIKESHQYLPFAWGQ